MKTLEAQGRCLNCGLMISKHWKLPVTELSIRHQTILIQWIKRDLPKIGVICAACLFAIEKSEHKDNPIRKLGHLTICNGCGKPVIKPSYNTYYDREDDLQLLFPWFKQLPTRFICFRCTVQIERRKEKIKKEAEGEISDDSVAEDEAFSPKTDAPTNLKHNPEEMLEERRMTEVARFENNRIILPSYSRPSYARRQCLVPNCKEVGQPIPRLKRKLIFLQSNMLLTRRATLCKEHARVHKWNFLAHRHCYKDFSIKQIEDAMNMCGKPLPIVDFDRINEMPEHVCKYWTGLGIEEFKELYEKLNVDTSQFQSLRNALAIHLLRKKTGDSLVRLANLFLMSTPYLSRQLMLIEKCYETLDNNK